MVSNKPNIILIMADDMGAWAMGCSGNTDVHTPNLDRLAAQGLLFENFFCTSPVCSPARASLMTGKMPSQHGVHDWISKGHINIKEVNSDLLEKLKDENSGWQYDWPRGQLMNDSAIQYIKGRLTYTDLLAGHGYTCGLSGKWHLGDAGHAQNGFSWWRTTAMGGENYFYPLMLNQDGYFHMLDGIYITDYITDNAITFLEENASKCQPFYLSVHYTSPHAPWQKNQHPAEYYDLYNDCNFTATPDLPHHPWHYEYSAKQRKENLQGYYSAITAMDHGIGQILEWLEENHMTENTLIVFTADNGMSMGHHGIFGKGNGTFPLNMYDSAVKVPMILSQPGTIQPGVTKGLYSHYDFLPTIAEMFGENLDASYPGHSFLNLLNDGQENPNDTQIVVMDEYGPVRMIRTMEWKYVHRYPYGPNELYHIAKDPDENVNLADKPEYVEKAAELRASLTKWFNNYTETDRDGSTLPVAGGGQIGLVGPQSGGHVMFLR